MNANDASLMGERVDLSAEIDGRSISVSVESAQVVSAVFSGASDDLERIVLSAVCSAMVGHSMREAAEHSAIYALRELVRSGVLAHGGSGNGILLPNNFSPEFARAQKIVRKIYRDSPFYNSDVKDWNFEDRGLSPAWTSQSKPEKKSRISALIEQFGSLSNVAQGSIVRFDIDKFERIEIELSNAIEIGDKPQLLMGLEQYLRTQTKERLEVFVFEMKDLNRIRRL